MADGRYDPGVTEPGWPALSLDDREAVVFDTDDVLTDTASVHAAAWKRLFDEYLRRRAACGSELFRPFTEADYLPEELDGLDFDVRHRGHWGVSLRFSPELVRVKVADAAGVPIRVGVNGEVVALAPGGMREFPS